MKKVNRKHFFRILINLVLLGFVFAIAKLSRLHQQFTQTKTYAINRNTLNEGFNFFEHFIVLIDSGNTKVFSSKCTHLGCRITKSEGQELVCPCHGSRYNKSGNPVQGPAPRQLETPDFELSGDEIIITFAAG